MAQALSFAVKFLEGQELARAELCHKNVRDRLQKSHWDWLSGQLISSELFSRRGEVIPWPEKEAEGKAGFAELYDFQQDMVHGDAVKCQDCGAWQTIEHLALECEQCQGTWCDSCAERGPKLPCKECPDFSKTHCHECFVEGKTLRCECADTDSWHSCCGRHAFECKRCDQLLCEGCESYHDCPEGEEEEED